jgi:hypothetical protein
MRQRVCQVLTDPKAMFYYIRVVPITTWTICPECHKNTGVLFPVTPSDALYFECEDCGHVWKIPTAVAMHIVNLPDTSTEPNLSRTM